MGDPEVTSTDLELAEQRALWRSQLSSIPSLPGGKNSWVPLLVELLRLVGEQKAVDLDECPLVSVLVDRVDGTSGAVPQDLAGVTWRKYALFLKPAGLVTESNRSLVLTSQGERVLGERNREVLATVLAERFRLFAETLEYLSLESATVAKVQKYFQIEYGMAWTSEGAVRSRMGWLEMLGLIEDCGSRRWRASDSGRSLLSLCSRVSADAVGFKDGAVSSVEPAPPAIFSLIERLRKTGLHEERKKYNIWVPSPESAKNKVENLLIIVNSAMGGITQPDLYEFVGKRFGVRKGSLDSMMPFLRAAGLLVEVSRGRYCATDAAAEWVESVDPVNFIRILHVNMRFVGEMLDFARSEVARADVYRAGGDHGMNKEKCRWILSLLADSGLLEEVRFGSVRATPLGAVLADELPLTDPQPGGSEDKEEDVGAVESAVVPGLRLAELALDPGAGDGLSGRAFELEIRDAFRSMGFDAELRSGSSDTDVLVSWRDAEGLTHRVTVEAKARSNGAVAHTDVSDTALETHRTMHQAERTLIVAPSFSGQTIRDYASKRGWVLIEAGQLADIVRSAIDLGLGVEECARLFELPNGLAQVLVAVQNKRRVLEIVSYVVGQLHEEATETGESLTPRDIYRDGRRTDLKPSAAEVLEALETVAGIREGAIVAERGGSVAEGTLCRLGEIASAPRHLRALADAIETGLI